MYTGSNLRVARSAIPAISERNRYCTLSCYRKCMILNYVRDSHWKPKSFRNSKTPWRRYRRSCIVRVMIIILTRSHTFIYRLMRILQVLIRPRFGTCSADTNMPRANDYRDPQRKTYKTLLE